MTSLITPSTWRTSRDEVKEEIEINGKTCYLTKVDNTNFTTFQYYEGMLGAAFFSLAYYLVPGYLIFAVSSLFTFENTSSNFETLLIDNLRIVEIFLPILISLILPIYTLDYLMYWRPFRFIPNYFHFKEISEIKHEELENLTAVKPTLLCLNPHGVFSFAALSGGKFWSNKWYTSTSVPTAVANAIFTTPLLKHIIGVLGIIPADKQSLIAGLKEKKAIVLYSGGIAELFLTDEHVEQLFLLKRKGFIKLGLTQGCAIVPIYLFGNTRVLTVLKPKFLVDISRKLGTSLTYFYGKFYLPIPMPYQCCNVIGTPLQLPLIENPTQEDVDKYHGLYVEEIKRIFETYKHQCEGYENKELILV